MWIKSGVSQEWRRPPSSPILRCRCGHSAMEDGDCAPLQQTPPHPTPNRVLEKRLFPLSSELSLLKCEAMIDTFKVSTWFLHQAHMTCLSGSWFQVSCKYWNVFLFEVDDLHTSEFCQATFVILIPD
ncbi:hypothetical protein EJB05_57384 [Eragrostis curvula]|uniref:Uncharacterized protein n=1 Tax=Eragrostis curvula TaxID=38414 RepID=A0A5J9SGJ4_9POAL|nr:hypothetical protein EJB05_57384 [Eragrostis curvula]